MARVTSFGRSQPVRSIERRQCSRDPSLRGSGRSSKAPFPILAEIERHHVHVFGTSLSGPLREKDDSLPRVFNGTSDLFRLLRVVVVCLPDNPRNMTKVQLLQAF